MTVLRARSLRDDCRAHQLKTASLHAHCLPTTYAKYLRLSIQQVLVGEEDRASQAEKNFDFFSILKWKSWPSLPRSNLQSGAMIEDLHPADSAESAHCLRAAALCENDLLSISSASKQLHSEKKPNVKDPNVKDLKMKQSTGYPDWLVHHVQPCIVSN